MTARRRRGAAVPPPEPEPRRVEVEIFSPGPLSIRYVRLANAILWDRNPKRHDLGGIIQSIRQHGFRDAPIYDATLGAIVAGNGRTTALQTMYHDGEPPPAGVRLAADGTWELPMQFGLDAESREQAEAFGLDHNLLTATGGDLGLPELAGLFDHHRLVEVLQAANVAGVQVVSLDPDDLEALMRPPLPSTPPSEFGTIDPNKATKHCCPKCGYEWN